MAIDFYFDFISAPGYLARGRLLALAERSGEAVVYRPVDIAQIRHAAGNTGPSNSQIPAKLRYMTRDFQRWAALYGMRMLERPKGWATGTFNRGTYLAQERGEADRYVEEAWACVWRDGIDCGAEEGWRELERRMGWAAGELPAFAERPDIQARYAAEIEAASARGVFGVPTFMVGEEMWWGNDRLEFLERWLEAQG